MSDLSKLAKLADEFIAASAPFMMNGVLTNEEQCDIDILTSEGREHAGDFSQFMEEADLQCNLRDDDPALFDMMLSENNKEGGISSLLIADIFARAADRNGVSDKVAGFIPVAKTNKDDVIAINHEGMDGFAKLVQIARTKHNLP